MPLRLQFIQPGRQCTADRMIGRATEHETSRRIRLVRNRDHRIGHALGVSGDDPVAAQQRVTRLAGGRGIVGCNRFRVYETAPEIGARRPRLDKREPNSERGQLLCQRLDKSLDAPLGRVIKAEARVGDLAPFARDLQDLPTPLLTQGRECGADQYDRPDERSKGSTRASGSARRYRRTWLR